MSTEPIKNCPKCHEPIPPEAPQGLCPKCLLAAASAPTECGSSGQAATTPTLETIANAFPHLEILEFIGQGGMGLVFKARQPKLDRFVALKLLPQKAGADPAFNERFNREARVLARLSHPNIVAVHDFGQAGPFFYLLMEYVDGVNLRQAMRAGRFSSAQALALVPRICDALQYAHEEGILHRDIKPENLLLDTRGRIKIADFGIAKLMGDTRDITLTASGSTIGTPHYMAPEQLEKPQDVDQRADVYSLGVVFYEMLTGELPIGRFVPPSEKTPLDPRVDQVVLRALEKERERRFQSAGDVRTQVEKITSNPDAGGPGATSPGQGARGAGSQPAPVPAFSAEVWGWSIWAIAAAALVALSVSAFFGVVLNSDRIQGNEITLLLVIIGLPALAGTLLANGQLNHFKSKSTALRGDRLALLAALSWPMLLMNVVVYAVPVLFVDSLQWHVFRMRGGPIGGMTRFVMGTALLILDVLLIRRWLKDWNANRRAPDMEFISRIRKTPRNILVLGGSAFAILLIVLLGSRAQMRHYRPPETHRVNSPSPVPGFEVPTGESPGQDRTYESALTVPPGYGLTVTALFCSNRVVIPASSNLSMTLIAPEGAPVQGLLSWSLLGNNSFADGAPLHLALGFTPGSDPSAKSIHLIPPEPITIDWVGEPQRVWPPQNGHSKFLLVKGTSANSPSNGQPHAQWAVGIETRLDPLPPELQKLESPRVILGADLLHLAPEPGQSTVSPVPPEEQVTDP